MTLARAKLKEVDPRNGQAKNSERDVTVQFNPETLKVSYTNQVSAGGAASAGGEQHVGAGATKLAVQLWFDVTATEGDAAGSPEDVREVTEKVLYFITPQGDGQNKVPPLLRFEWGTFSFDGIVESMEESLEFFSAEGVPLRASVSINMSQPRIKDSVRRGSAPPPGAGGGGGGPGGPGGTQGTGSAGAAPGTRPLTSTPSGATVQGLAAARSGGDASDWRALANANGIENPRIIPTGTLLDLSAGVKGGR